MLIFVLFAPCLCAFISLARVTLISKIAAHSVYDMFSLLYLSVPDSQFGFPHLGFWGGAFVLIATVANHCLLLPLVVT